MALEPSVERVDGRDVASLGTLHARAFHPGNAWHRRVLPASISPWWRDKYALDMADPAYRLLKVSSPAAPDVVLGLICVRRYAADERGAGRWTRLPPPPGADADAYAAMIRSMIQHRERLMLGRAHLCVDYLAVDAESQGRGFGTRLLARACGIADDQGLDVFVQANEFAEGFYRRFGFRSEQKLQMPGGMTECFMVRAADDRASA
ncbi:NAD(P)-binding protein [Purpureocillium lavendulum]|uniref:NAD(P)-binding protein n=1 Tax=Purpureocillium lavendulum TaxID=1247861 RepID=A0AB34FJN3_9HYPO|nr:NAD(P)-binding protein [Purpureocillium lavendulum]